MIFSHKLAVFPFQSSSAFCILQSNVHEIWGRFFSSTMKDDINYSPSDCFETFPFPEGWETHLALEATGKAYYEHRAALMIRNDEGMTKTYNRFHDPYENDSDIGRLRELHVAMDPRSPRRLRMDRHPHRLRFPPRLRDRRCHLGPEEEAVPLPLAGRRPRRGTRPPPRPQRRTRRRGSPCRRIRGK